MIPEDFSLACSDMILKHGFLTDVIKYDTYKTDEIWSCIGLLSVSILRQHSSHSQTVILALGKDGSRPNKPSNNSAEGLVVLVEDSKNTFWWKIAKKRAKETGNRRVDTITAMANLVSIWDRLLQLSSSCELAQGHISKSVMSERVFILAKHTSAVMSGLFHDVNSVSLTWMLIQ